MLEPRAHGMPLRWRWRRSCQVFWKRFRKSTTQHDSCSQRCTRAGDNLSGVLASSRSSLPDHTDAQGRASLSGVATLAMVVKFLDDTEWRCIACDITAEENMTQSGGASPTISLLKKATKGGLRLEPFVYCLNRKGGSPLLK